MHTSSLLPTPSVNHSKMKRKTDTNESQGANGQPNTKKRALSNEEVLARFNKGLFDSAKQQKYTQEYAESAPYVLLLLCVVLYGSLLTVELTGTSMV